MRNEVIFDDRGHPDILVVFTPDELKLPDTLKGRKVKEYAISKYPNTMIDGRPYSLPFMPSAVNVDHDEAIQLCEAKGPGWHLTTNDEWAALARQSWENDTVSYSGAGDIVKRLQKLKDGGEVAIKRTVSDFTSRGPGWVSKGIREHYGVDTAAIKDAAKKPKRGRTSIRVAGISVDGATLEYKGRTLTPIHFKMSPKARPSAQQKKPIRIPGQLIAGGSPVAMVRPPRKYTVKVTIIKGQRTAMSSDTFLTAGKGGAIHLYSKP